MHTIEIKRVYEAPTPKDGYRILVDKIWPRGIKKEDLHFDEWNKAITPSTELRKWFNHQPERFDIFEKLYKSELLLHTEELERIKSITKKKRVTLLFGAKDYKLNQAIVLKNFLTDM